MPVFNACRTDQVSYHYDLSISPSDGRVYVAFAERKQILRLKNEEDSFSDYSSGEDDDEDASKLEVFAGTGHRCLPGAADACGDGGPAIDARLDYPKSVAVAPDGTAFVSDGRSVRVISPGGVIDTLLGGGPSSASSGPPSPLPCDPLAVFQASEARLQWPTALALDPLDGSLHVVDDTMVIRQVCHLYEYQKTLIFLIRNTFRYSYTFHIPG